MTYQGSNGRLWTFNSNGPHEFGLGMSSGTSPAEAAAASHIWEPRTV